MRHWTLSKDDIKLTEYKGKDMGLDIEISELYRPTIKIINSKHRYVYCRVRRLEDDEDFDVGDPLPLPKLGNYINYNFLDYPMQTDFFKRFNMIGSKHNVPIFIVGGHPTTEEYLPLDFGSKYEIICVTPSIPNFSNSFIFNSPEWGSGSIAAWFMTLFDLYLTGSSVISAIDEKKINESSWIYDLLFSFSSKVENMISEFYVSGFTAEGALTPMLDLFVKLIIEFFSGKDVEEWLEQYFPSERDSANNKIPGTVDGIMNSIALVKAWGSFVNLLNFIERYRDIRNSPAYAKFTIDIPVRRQPALRIPDQNTPMTIPIELDEGQRIYMPIEVALPDGRLFSFSNTPDFLPLIPDPQSTKSPQESFIAEVNCLAEGEQGYELNNIVDMSLASRGIVEPFPVKLTILSEGSMGRSSVGVRSQRISDNLSPSSEPILCNFPEGLGPWIEGLAEGEAKVSISVSYSQPSDVSFRTSTATIPLKVKSGPTPLEWDVIRTVHAGTRINVPLKVSSVMGDFDLLLPFTANTTLSDDGTWIELSYIVPDGGFKGEKSLYWCYPFKLKISIEGNDFNGKSCLAFMLPRSITTLVPGRVSFPEGLQKALMALRPGEPILIATLIPEGDDKASTKERRVKAVIIEGKPSLSVSPTSITFDDELVKDFTVDVTLPGGDTYSTASPLLSNISVEPLKLQLQDIYYKPEEDEPMKSPIDLVFEEKDGNVIVFSGTELIGGIAQCWPRYGAIKNFLRAKTSGKSTVKISGRLLRDTPFDLVEPTPVKVDITVAEPAKAILSSYYEVINGTPSINEIINGKSSVNPKPLSDNATITLWKTATIILKGYVDNYCDKTKTSTILRLIVNDIETPAAFEIGKEGNRTTFLTTIDFKECTNRVRVEAEKATNFGVPGFSSFTLIGQKPIVNVDKSYFHDIVGEREQSIVVWGSYALCAVYNLRKGNGTSSDWDMHPDVDTGEFACHETEKLEEGTNIVRIIVRNPFGIFDQQWTIVGMKPILKITSVGGNTVANKSVDIYTENVQVVGEASLVDKAEISVSHPGGQYQPFTTVKSGPFSLNMNFSQDGYHKIKMNAINGFGSSEEEVTVYLHPIVWEWVFSIDFLIRQSDQYYLKIDIYQSSNLIRTVNYCAGFNTGSYQVKLTDDEMKSTSSNKLPAFLVSTYKKNGERIGGVQLYESIDGNVTSYRHPKAPLSVKKMILLIPTERLVPGTTISAPGIWPNDGYSRVISTDYYSYDLTDDPEIIYYSLGV